MNKQTSYIFDRVKTLGDQKAQIKRELEFMDNQIEFMCSLIVQVCDHEGPKFNDKCLLCGHKVFT